MFCSNCGKKITENSVFCSGCGARVENAVTDQSNQSFQTALQGSVEEGTIDLRGTVSHSAPQEKKYKPLLWASILCIPVLALMIIVGKLFYIFVMEFSSEMLFFGLLIVAFPFFLASIPFFLHAKKKYKLSGSNRKMSKGSVPLLYTLTILTVAFAMVCGFSGAFSTAGLLNAFSFILFAAMAIILVVFCNLVSLQNGTEAYLCFAKALMISFLLVAPVGYVLGLIFRAMEFALIILMIAVIAFFMFGGSIIFIRRN